MKKSISLTVLLGLLLASTAIADPGDTLWTRTYGGIYSDYGWSVQQTSDGSFITAGETASFGAGAFDVYFVKTDANGNTLWTRTYGGSDYDGGYSVDQTTDGGYIITGYTNSFGAGDFDFYLVKTDTDGDTLWTHTYGGSSTEYSRCVQQTSDGGYIVVGRTYSFGAGSWDIYLVKTDASGNTLWTRTYGGSDYEGGWSVQQTTDGGYIVAGLSDSFGGGSEVYLVKTDANGDTVWTRTYGGSDNDQGNSVQQTTDGGYIVAGVVGLSESFGGGADFYLVKTDANGDTLWTRAYGGSSTDWAYSVQQTTDGGYIVVGYTQSYGAGSQDVYLVKTDANGDTLWTRTYGGSEYDEGWSVHQTTDGGYILTGQTYSFGAGRGDLYLVRVAGEAPQPDVSIEIIPDDPPVTVPQGGSFGFTGTLTNNTEDPQVTDAWTMATGPQVEIYGPFKVFQDLALEAHETRSAHFNQHVHNRAPLGFYNYIAYCGDYPGTVMDSSSFQVEVIAPTFSRGEDLGWLLSGSFDKSQKSSALLSEFALLGNYPNPFNASTVISYELPQTAHVELEVFNISGQKVATLVDSRQQAGYKSVVWDATEVSSGVFFYKLTVGDFTEVKRMTLLR